MFSNKVVLGVIAEVFERPPLRRHGRLAPALLLLSNALALRLNWGHEARRASQVVRSVQLRLLGQNKVWRVEADSLSRILAKLCGCTTCSTP